MGMVRAPKKLTPFRTFLARCIAVVIRLLVKTWRPEYVGPDGLGVGIYCFWHSRLMAPVGLLRFYRRRGVIVVPMNAMISASKDGAFLSEVIRLFELTAIRGSSSRRGAVALLECRGLLEAGQGVSITPDGPRGPALKSKPGPVHLAGLTGCPIYPICVEPDRYWELKSWDKFRVPKPFARIRIRLATPMHVPAGLDESRIAELCQELDRRLSEGVDPPESSTR